MDLADVNKSRAREAVRAEIEYRSVIGRPFTQAGLIEFTLDTMQDMLMPQEGHYRRPVWYEEQSRT